LFGGRVAEAIALDDISTGASNDLQRATEICRDMVTKYGMSDSVGPVVYDDGNGEVFLGKDYGHVNNYSEQTSARIDAEIEKIMRDAYARTDEILRAHYDKLELVANTLLDKEKINSEEFESLMKDGKLPEKAEIVETTSEDSVEIDDIKDKSDENAEADNNSEIISE
jgi:cell division protease FtsH